MSGISNSIHNFRLMDDLARKDTVVHRIHPLSKLITTLAYLIVVISYGKYDVIAMLPLVFYPIILLMLAEIPSGPIIKRILLIQPLVIGIGIFNPIFVSQNFDFVGINLSKGWIILFGLIIKSCFTVSAALLLVSATGIDKLAKALRILRVPRLLVLQLVMTYRYISVLLEEVGRSIRAYSLRAPGQKGIKMNAWGSLTGQLLLRTFDRAERVYQAMLLRGFSGEYSIGGESSFGFKDLIYILVWVGFFAASRIWNLPMVLESFFIGVVS